MSSLVSGLNTARNALITQTNVLNVTAHNVANADTDGYSRQEAQLNALSYNVNANLRMSQLLAIGNGVEVDSVSRARYTLYDDLYRIEYQDLNYYSKTETLLNQVETLFNEPSDQGIGGALDSFFNAWEDLANSPQDAAARQSLYSMGEELSTMIQRTYSSLATMREDIDTELTSMPEAINEITEQIADLNVSIRKLEGQDTTANDLRDQRDKLLDDLSQYVDVTSVEHDDGTITALAGNVVLVERETSEKLSINAVEADSWGQRHTVITTERGIEFEPVSGELAALLDFRDESLTELMGDLNEMAESLVTNVNFIHQLGYGLDGNSGYDFFNSDNVMAYNIELSSDIDDINHIAASGDGTVGDNANALRISELSSLRVVEGNHSIKEYYNALVTDLGILTSAAEANRSNKELLVTEIENSRESIKGVSIDEELITMIEAQRIYQSASRLIVVMDELLEEVVNLR